VTLTVGALFAGYGGIELALSSVLDVELSWFAEFDDAPSRILAHHHPGVPNLHDVTKVDWSSVPPVDVITGGSPCQDLSHAGKRKGMKAGTRSGLWASMCDAIDIIRPRLVVWENVRGALSAEADSALEPCPGCVGDRDDGAVLRALGRVLGDLAELGYDARWYGLRAADVGAPHGRFRIFLFATPADAHLSGRSGVGRLEPIGCDPHGRSRADGLRQASEPATHGLTLLPTPAVNDMGEGKTVEHWDAWTDRMKTEHGNGNGHGKSLAIEAQRLLPSAVPWGDYAPAIARWETFLGRPAPPPTEPGTKGGHRLSPRFVEWLMGLPEGHVTDVPGITRNQALKALGNGVVPQQCAAALRAFLHDIESECAA
jgi:DNA (cytosine-5)-methyltransferase 1